MQLTRLLWIVLGGLVLLGIGSGIYMSLETMAPGVEGDRTSKAVQYSFANRLHGTVMGLSLPLTVVGGLTCFLLAERRRQRLAKIALIVCGYATLGLAISVLGFSQSLQGLVGSVENLSVVFACIGFVSLLLLRHPSRNASAFLYLGACLIPGLFYFVTRHMMTQGGTRSLINDTLIATSLSHTIGLTLLLTMFSAMSVWVYSRGARLNGWVTALYVGLLLVTFRFYFVAHFAAGVNGMPRRYVDYPQSFASQMEAASWYSLLYAGLIVFGLARFAFAVWSRDRSTAADVF